MIWDDGRSGAAGQVAGDVTLGDLEPECGSFRKVRGTVFETDDMLMVGRVCGTDTYLSRGVHHWANISRDQYVKLIHDAREAGKSLRYLFVTATDGPPRVEYWLIPGEILGQILGVRHKSSPGDVLGVHIRCKDGRFFLDDVDVTDHHHVARLDQEQATVLKEALRITRRISVRGGANRATSQETTPIGTMTGEETSGEHQLFQVPVSGTRKMTLSVPIPLNTRDIERLKAWIDLMADILTQDQAPRAIVSHDDLDDCFAALEPDDELERALEGQRRVDNEMWQ